MCSRVVLVGLVALAATACGAKGDQLRTQAASDFTCPADQIRVTSVASYVERVRGCGRDVVYVYDHESRKWASPLDRGAFDLGCSKAELRVAMLDAETAGVEGCGRRAVYSRQCETKAYGWGGAKTECVWAPPRQKISIELR